MPIYEVTGNFACHDVKFADTVSVLVQRDSEPTPEQAESLLWSAAADAVRFARGDVYDIEFVCTEVILKSRENIGCTGCG